MRRARRLLGAVFGVGAAGRSQDRGVRARGRRILDLPGLSKRQVSMQVPSGWILRRRCALACGRRRHSSDDRVFKANLPATLGQVVRLQSQRLLRFGALE
jgi:hypothetical protein